MSHIVSITTEVRDEAALTRACRRLNLELPRFETCRLFTTEVSGHAVRLPAWRYPVVCELPKGIVHYDNFEGRWGDQRELHRLLQGYAIEKTRLEAHKQGHSVLEEPLQDGSCKLTILLGGAS